MIPPSTTPSATSAFIRQLVGSALKADSANNNINPFHQQLEVVASPHLTDTDAWFLLADKNEHSVNVVVRKAIETKAGGMDLGFLNDVVYYKARYREALGVMNPFGVYGTTGAA